MKNEPIYMWDEKEGLASCRINYNNNEFLGLAHCHPDDKDMQSKLTGQHIAEARAVIQMLKFIKANEIKPKLAALKQYYYSINRSKQFNPKSYEVKMLYRQIQNYKFDLETINKKLAITQIELKTYIMIKDKAYQTIRKQREAKNN